MPDGITVSNAPSGRNEEASWTEAEKQERRALGGKAGEQDLILETLKVWLDLIGSVGNDGKLSRIGG